MTRHYELLNYSEHGTTVDNVLYSCDFSDKSSAAGSQTSSVVGNVRKLIGKGKNKEDAAPTLSPDKELMSSRTNEAITLWSYLASGGPRWLLHNRHSLFVKYANDSIMWLFELTNQPLQNPNKLKVNVIISFGDQSEHLNERSRSIKTHYKQWVLHNPYRGDHRRQVWSTILIPI